MAPGGAVGLPAGPGPAEVHRAPRVIASWDGLDAGWQPASTGPGEYDLALGPLITALHAPAVAAGLPTRAPAEHGQARLCVALLGAGRRPATGSCPTGSGRGSRGSCCDGAGIAEHGDRGGPRWVAVRHAEDHIHIAVVLVRQDTGRRFWPHHDYPKLRAAARRIEQRLGLTVTAAPDGTAAPRPSRGEMEKAGREGRVPARVELRRAAQQAAVAASDVDGFVAYLQERGYRVGLRRAPSGDLLGYKLARPGDVTAAGEPVFYSGSKLAPDLSLPRLQQRWGRPSSAGLAAVRSTMSATCGVPPVPCWSGGATRCRRPGAAQRRKILTAWPRPRRRYSPPCALPRQARPGAGSPLRGRRGPVRPGGPPAARFDRPGGPGRARAAPAGAPAGRAARAWAGGRGGSCRAGGRAGRVDRGDQCLAPGSWSAASGAPGSRRRPGTAAVAARIPRCRCRGRGGANTAISTEGLAGRTPDPSPASRRTGLGPARFSGREI